MQRRFVDIESAEKLVLGEDKAPPPGSGELLIDVDFAGVNRADVLQRLGLYPVPQDASPIMGLEVAGTVIAAGEGATAFSPGDRVCALVHGGGYATHAIAREDHCLAIPEGVSNEAAAALPEALLTVWHNVFVLGALKPNETVLIHGGGSGIGSIGIQMAKCWGSRVVATAGGPDKVARVKALGADGVIDYRRDNLADVFAEAGYTGKVDVILDIAGGDMADLNLNLAAPDGRVVCIGVMRGATAEINLFNILMKRLTLTGSTLRGMGSERRASGFRAIAETMMPRVAQGEIQPIIERVFPMDAAMEAHELMQGGSHMGKILLDCRSEDSP